MNVLVTGATAGFGEAIAKVFINAGHTVIGTGRRSDKLMSLQSQLGEQFLPLCFDVSDLNACQTALENLPPYAKKIDVLINNAGLALGLEPAHQTNFDDWQRMIDTNIKGLAQMCHLILPQMVANNHGLIINIGSVAGTYPYPGGNVYGATKAFVRQFSLNLRADLAGTKVRVTNLEPGLCGGTEFSQVRFKGDTQKASEVYKNIEFITPEDIANIVFWVANQPEHVNLNTIEVMPTAQSFAPLAVSKINALL